MEESNDCLIQRIFVFVQPSVNVVTDLQHKLRLISMKGNLQDKNTRLLLIDNSLNRMTQYIVDLISLEKSPRYRKNRNQFLIKDVNFNYAQLHR